MELDPNQHQGSFGESFVRVLASAAGLTVARADLDVTGDDFTICYPGRWGNTRHPKIDVQVKSWKRTRARCKDGYWKYRMWATHFNELAGLDFSLPRFLILVIVPDHAADYAIAREDLVELKHAAYWQSLRNRQPVDGPPDRRIPVDIPCTNLLTVDALRALLAPDTPIRTEA